jgi:hypothetical protein
MLAGMKTLLCGLALASLAIAPVTSEAISLGADSVFTPSVGSTSPCTLCVDVRAGFLLTNNSATGGNISQVVIDMTSAASPLVKFGGAAGLAPNLGFQALVGGTATGFTGASVTDKMLTLNFTGFDPGDVLGFSFAVDIDDSSRTVTASEFAGSTLKVIFGGLGSYYDAFEPILNSTLAKASVRGDTQKVPEASSLLLVCASLLVAGLFSWKRLSAGVLRLR